MLWSRRGREEEEEEVEVEESSDGTAFEDDRAQRSVAERLPARGWVQG